MSIRYAFGPRFVGSWPRPVVPGELPDPVVGAKIAGVRPSTPGKTEMDVTFSIPAYDPTEFNSLEEVHAICYPPGHGIPTDPAVAVQGSQAKATASASGISGAEVTATIVGAEDGDQTIVTVLGFQDATPPATPAPADPASAAPVAATDPSDTAPADPTAAVAPATPASTS